LECVSASALIFVSALILGLALSSCFFSSMDGSTIPHH
jgi:hypothetical protein